MINIENNMISVRVVKVTALNKFTKAIRMHINNGEASKDFSFIPGQFVMLGVLGYGEAALTITSAPSELPEFEIAVRSIGVATQAMHRLKVGDSLYMRGPLGNTIMTKNMIGKQVLLVAGGLGLAPLRSIIQVIRDDNHIVKELKLIVGAKTPEDLLFKGELDSWKEFADVYVTVDKADHHWTGETGRVSETLKKVQLDKDAVVVVCGPPVMYTDIAKMLLDKGLSEDNIEFMLERRMKCGIGKCQHCTCGEKYVCIDGPMFTWKDIKNNAEAML